MEILKIIAAILTVATGLLGAIKPGALPGFTGLTAAGPRGISEIRASFGGLFIGLGLAPFILAVPTTYSMLGIMYLAMALLRAFSMVVDKSWAQSNIISLVVEIVFGIILIV